MMEIMKKQQLQKEMLQEAYSKESYTIKKPFVALNPYEVCPLSGLVMFFLEQSASITIEVHGQRRLYQLEKGHHELPILGLKPNMRNEICMQSIDQDGVTVEHTFYIQTNPLPSSYPEIQVKVSQKNQMAEGLFSLSLGRSEGVKTIEALYSIVDEEGSVRWFYTGMTAHVFRKLKNGHLIVDAPISSGICGAYTSAGFIEMDFLGHIKAFYKLPNGLHHDVYELPSGNFLAITQGENTKQDLLVEIDRKSGEVIKEWNFREILDPSRQTVIDKISVNHPLDWLHLNAIVYDETDDSIIATSRNQSCMVKFDKSTSKIQWIIAPNEGWNDVLSPYVLNPVNEQDLGWAPHTPVIGKNGTYLMFDNGNFRSYDIDKARHAYENFSRGIEYRIDLETGTFEKVWSFGEERGNSLYCPYLGSISLLENDNRLMCFGGITKDIFGGPTDDMKSNRMKNEVVIVETTGDRLPEVVFEMAMKDRDITKPLGYKCYRCEKITF